MNVPYTSNALGLTIKSADDIKTLEPKQMLSLHNEISNASVKRFADKKSGVKRTVEAFQTWQGQQTEKTPKLVTADHKSFRKDSARGKVIAAASKAGGATRAQLKEISGWDDTNLTAALSRVESYNGLTVTRTGEGDEQIIVITGVLRTRKAFAFDPLPEKQRRAHKESGTPTKRSKVVAMLTAKGGASFEEIQAATDWNDRDAYEGIRLIHSYLGYGLKETGEGKIIAFRA
jgi:hypothetical protein